MSLVLQREGQGSEPRNAAASGSRDRQGNRCSWSLQEARSCRQLDSSPTRLLPDSGRLNREITNVLFGATRSAGICHSSNRKLMHHGRDTSCERLTWRLDPCLSVRACGGALPGLQSDPHSAQPGRLPACPLAGREQSPCGRSVCMSGALGTSPPVSSTARELLRSAPDRGGSCGSDPDKRTPHEDLDGERSGRHSCPVWCPQSGRHSCPVWCPRRLVTVPAQRRRPLAGHSSRPCCVKEGSWVGASSPLFMLGWAFAVARGEGLAWMPHVLSYCNMLPICFRKLSGNCFANCPRSLTLAALLFSVISLCVE